MFSAFVISQAHRDEIEVQAEWIASITVPVAFVALLGAAILWSFKASRKQPSRGGDGRDASTIAPSLQPARQDLMPIRTQYTSCGKKLQIRESLIGKRIKCPACGNTFSVEASDEAAAV